MTKIQVDLPDDELEALRKTAERSGRSLTELVREATRNIWLRSEANGPVALWDGVPSRTSREHDAIYEES